MDDVATDRLYENQYAEKAKVFQSVQNPQLFMPSGRAFIYSQIVVTVAGLRKLGAGQTISGSAEEAGEEMSEAAQDTCGAVGDVSGSNVDC